MAQTFVSNYKFCSSPSDPHTLPSDMNPCSRLNFLTCFENFLLYLEYNTSFKWSNTSMHFIASQQLQNANIVQR